MNEIDKVIQLAEEELGYLEKSANANLDDKTLNVGINNFTKYARDLDNITGFYNGKKNGYPWCDVFVDWLFVTAFGVDRAKEMLCYGGQLGAGCGFSMNYYKQAGQFHSTPERGDQIFFKQGNSIIHTGLVVEVSKEKVHTIEGNTSSEDGVVYNGGLVARKSYRLNAAHIAGYGRPKYNLSNVVPVEVQKSPSATYSHVEFVKDIQRCIGTTVDGIAGPKTISKTITVSKHINNRHAVVKYIQKYLSYLGYTEVGIIDGIAGPKFETAVKHFQRNNKCIADGEITAGYSTWRKLLKMK